MPDLLTAKEVAAILRVHESWVRRNGHTLPGYFKFGWHVRWSGPALKAWVERATSNGFTHPHD